MSKRGTITAKRKLDKLWNETSKLVLSSGFPCPSYTIFNPYDPPQHWLMDYPKPPKYEEGSDRGATDENW